MSADCSGVEMTKRTMTIIVIALVVLLTPVWAVALLSVAFLLAQPVIPLIYSGNNEFYADGLGLLVTIVLFIWLLVAAVFAVSPLRRFFSLK